jgi:hypothetical protein
VPRPGDDREPCARYRIVNLVRDGQWRQRIGITPDQQSVTDAQADGQAPPDENPTPGAR